MAVFLLHPLIEPAAKPNLSAHFANHASDSVSAAMDNWMFVSGWDR
jgi:hypothetical protein